MTTKSPIETSLFNAIVELAPKLGLNTSVHFAANDYGKPLVASDDDYEVQADGVDDALADLLVLTQVAIDGYRVDIFLVLARNLTGRPFSDGPETARPMLIELAVECDGHEWHERTQQQAAYDRSRDRALLKGGISTIRFTGSEIYRDPNQCAREALDCIKTLFNKAMNFVVADAGATARSILDKALAAIAEERKKAGPG